MYDLLKLTEMGFSLLLAAAAWLTARKAANLRCSGSAERLHRKTRKMLFRTVWLTAPALVVFFCIGWMVFTLPSLFWEDRILLNAPLIGAPMLAIWFTTVPMIWSQRKLAGRMTGPLDALRRSQLRSRLFVLPYQATALGAVTSFYFAAVSPVPYDPLIIAAPVTVYIIVMLLLWLHHDRRFSQMRVWLRTRRARQMGAGTNMSLPDRKAKSRTQA